MNPSARSMAYLRANGFTVANVEKWNPHVRIRQDLFGFGDLMAINNGISTFIIQCTSSGNLQARVKKIKAEPRAKQWLRSPWRRILVHGWAKRGKRGERKLWKLTEVEIK
jgi:hypothetical protein